MSDPSDYERLVEEITAQSYEATITTLRAEVEKLKAERDEARHDDAIRFTESCDLKEEVARLTSQLEQAREIIAPFADAARSFTVSIAPDGIDDGLTVSARIAVMRDYEAVLSTYHFSRASQWIKDRQAKGEG